MFPYIKKSILVLLLLGLIVGYLTIDYHQDSNQYSALVSCEQPTATFILASNPTTGYSWNMKSKLPKTLIKVTRHYQTNPHAPGIVGVGGIETWAFTVSKTAISTGKVIHIHMIYQRPWLKNASPANTLTLTIHTQAHWLHQLTHWLIQ